MVWIKGQRCGIDNCASRFYQVLSGQRICQNGHVQEGLETTGDDDDFVAVGQRIARPRNSAASQLIQEDKESQILRGRLAKLKTIELLQAVFRHQIQFIIDKTHAPSDLEIVAKNLWTIFLKHKKMGNITLNELVCLGYLVTRAANLPVLLSDFGFWIRNGDFPYFECWRIVDQAQYQLIPAEQRRHFRPAAQPGTMVLHKTTKILKKILNLNFPSIDDRYACFKICRGLMFAPQVYVGALNILQLVDSKRLERDQQLSSGEETAAACAVVVSAKLYYGMDDIPRLIPQDRVGNEFNWQIWRDFMRKVWLMQPDLGKSDERLVQFWSGDDIDNYLSWFQKRLCTDDGIDKRLAQMFPMPEQSEYSTKTVDIESLNELCALLHNTASDNQSEEADSEIPCGGYYQAFSVRSDTTEELPEMVGLLYKLISVLLGADEIHIRRVVRLFEKWIKNQHPKLIVNEASVNGASARGT